jgi:hypothetical protein
MPDTFRPPEWALQNAVRLDMREFALAFSDSWRSAVSGMEKVETWQTYQEPETQSLAAFENADYRRVGQLVEEEAKLDGFVYDDVQHKGRSFVRQRIVKLPLTSYLEWEFWNYRIRARLGEIVQVIDHTNSRDDLPNASFFDCLLFDNNIALVHDYGTDGLQVGGWLVTSQVVLDRLAGTIAGLKAQSVPLETFIAEKRIELPGEGQVL